MDAPPRQRVEMWTIRSHDYRVTIWPPDVWRGLTPAERPGSAFLFGGLGWVDVQPVGAAPPLGPGRREPEAVPSAV